MWRGVETRSSSCGQHGDLSPPPLVSSSVYCMSLTCGVVWTRDLHPVVSTVTSPPPLVSSSVHCLSLACGVVWTRDLHPVVSTVTSPPTSVQLCPLFESDVWRGVDTRSSSCGQHGDLSSPPPLVSSSVHCLSLACGVVWTRDLHPGVSTVTSPSPPTSVQFCPLFESDVWRGVDTRSSSCGQHGDLPLPPLVSSSVYCLSLTCGVVWTRDLHPVVSTVTSPSPPTSVQFCPLFESGVWRGVDTRSASCGQHGDLSPH